MEFSGREAYCTRIYTAYRPGIHKPPNSKNTTVYEQHDRYIRQHRLKGTPREIVDSDLYREILEQLQSKQIILMLDANEDVQQGKFNNMMNGLGMRNGIQTRTTSPMPATHHRGSRTISAIYCSRNIAVTRAGILPIGTGVRGDHKNIYIDVQIQSVMGGKMYIVSPPPMRTLKLNDSRIYLKFIKLVKKHLKANNIKSKAEKLYSSSKYPATSQMVKAMEEIDEQMGRAITNGLRKCRTIFSGKIPYSILFKNLSRTNRLWLLVMKKKKGQKISISTIRRLAKQVGVSNPMSYHFDEVISRLRESKKQYEKFIPHAPTERKIFFEDLASANAAVSNQKKMTILKNIMQTESSREQHAIIRSVFPKKISSSKKVDRVQVKQGEVWKEIGTPHELVEVLQTENKEKYSCTNGTPLMKQHIHQKMGNFAEGKLAKEIQHGHVDPKKLFDEWTARMLSETKFDPKIPRIPVEITSDELEDAWRVSKEDKAASPSGRYNATYKAMSKDKELLDIMTVQINLPFKMGQPYQRWSTFLDIMAFKKSHCTKINTLRSIIISEGDWNVAGRIYVTRKLMKQAEEHNLLPEEHLGGRKNRKSIDGVITKRLFLDNSRLLRKPAVILSTDAANCYDRMVHKFICMVCSKWGLEESVLRALLKPLQSAKHYTRTAYGDSHTCFTGTNLQGAGQGNTSAAPFWTCVSSPMINIMKNNKFQSKMRSPLSIEEIVLTLMSFVDDTEVFLMIDSDDIEELLDLAHTTLITWKKVLQATGGDMRSKKCAWILLHYGNRNEGYKSHSLSIEDEDGVSREIERYEEDTPREYLGVLQQATGKEDAQLEKLYEKVHQWNSRMKKSKLYNAHNYSAIFTRIHKSLQYPLPATILTEDELQKLSNKLYEVSLPKCGINRKFPIDFRDLPHQYQGLALPNLYLYQETSKLMSILSTNFTDHIMWKQYKLGLEILQMQTGVLGCVLNSDYSKFSGYVESTWITSQWEFMWNNDMSIGGWELNIAKQRVNDMAIMEVFANAGYDNDKLKLLNECRTYLHIITVSDVVNGDGVALCPMAMDGRRNMGRKSIYQWKEMKKPSQVQWFKWREALKETLCASSKYSTLVNRLGKWINTDQHQWYWWFHEETGRLYHKVGNLYRVYRPSSRRTMHLKQPIRLFKAIEMIQHNNLPENCSLASAEREGNGYTYVKYYGSSKEKLNQNPSVNMSDTSILPFRPSQDWMHKSSNLEQVSKEDLEAMMTEPVRIVADGSFKKNHSSMAVILEPLSQTQQIITAGPVPANFSSPTHTTDPYRSEMAGLLAGITIMEKIEEVTKMKTKVILSCDNDAALKVASSFTYFNARMKHYDIARSLITGSKRIRSKITAEKVMGHAEEKQGKRKATRTEILNQSCDRLAKQARKTYKPIGNRQLDGEGLTLWYKDQKINHDVKSHVEHIYMSKRAERILCTKYAWDRTQFHDVDWRANGKAMSMVTVSTRIWIAKLVTKFLPIGRNMQRMNKWTMSHCPRCEVAEETHDHLLQCKHVPSYELLQTQLSKLRDWMVKMKTPQQLETQLIAYISKYLHMPTVTIILPHLAIQQQLQLGEWEHFMQGRLHSTFSEYMDKIYEQMGEKRKSGHMWSAGLIQRLWTLIHRPIWELRNKYVHQKLNEAKITRNREELLAKVRNRFVTTTPSSLLTRDQHLFEKPIDEILQSTDMTQRAWLVAVDVACRERDKAGERDIIEANMTLMKWMRETSPTNIRRGNGGDRRLKFHKKKKRVNAKPRRQLKHLYRYRRGSNCRQSSVKKNPSVPIHRSGFFKPP